MSTYSIVRRAGLVAALTLAAAVPSSAQTLPPYTHTADLSGPRFGLTLLSDGIVEQAGGTADRRRPALRLAVRLAVREAVLHPGQRRHDGHRMGGAPRRTRTEHRAAKPELDSGAADPRRRRIRNRAQHHPRRHGAGLRDRHDLPDRCRERAGERRHRPFEVRHARQRADGIQPPAAVSRCHPHSISIHAAERTEHYNLRSVV